MSNVADQLTAAPTRKVTAGVAAGAVVTILVWVLSLFGVSVPADVSAAVTTVVAFATSYMVRDRL